MVKPVRLARDTHAWLLDAAITHWLLRLCCSSKSRIHTHTHAWLGSAVQCNSVHVHTHTHTDTRAVELYSLYGTTQYYTALAFQMHAAWILGSYLVRTSLSCYLIRSQDLYLVLSCVYTHTHYRHTRRRPSLSLFFREREKDWRTLDIWRLRVWLRPIMHYLTLNCIRCISGVCVCGFGPSCITWLSYKIYLLRFASQRVNLYII